MSDDPNLYNDQLRSSTTPSVSWDGVPELLQKEIIELLGSFRLVKYRRVDKNWKNLLEKGSRVLLVDDFIRYPICKIDLLGTFFGSFAKSYKVYQTVLRRACEQTRVIIFDLARPADNASKDSKYLLRFMMKYLGVGPSAAIIAGKLEHVILTGGRMSPDSYLVLVHSLKLDRIQRPLTCCLHNCIITYTESNRLIRPTYRSFPRVSAEASVPNWSVQFLTDKYVLYHCLVRMFTKVLFPYTAAQIAWLENCLRTAVDLQGYIYNISIFDCLRCCTIAKKNWYATMETELGIKKDHSRFIGSVEVLAIALPYCVREISAGRLHFPLPPEPVPVLSSR